jgi:hypothetical protein
MFSEDDFGAYWPSLSRKTVWSVAHPPQLRKRSTLRGKAGSIRQTTFALKRQICGPLVDE